MKQNIPVDPTTIRDTNNKSDIDANDIGISTPIQNIENEDAVYWHSTYVGNHEHFLSLIEASHHDKLSIDSIYQKYSGKLLPYQNEKIQ